MCAELGGTAAFVVTGKGSYKASGAEALLAAQLSGLRQLRFWDFHNNPRLEDAIRGRDACRAMAADLIIAVGGGSALDMAKLVAAFAAQQDEPLGYVLGDRTQAATRLPLVAMPTTCGTGSESTQFAVVYVDGTKYSLSHPSMLPTAAIVDPELLIGLPAQVVAASGMDALCQAVEAFWSVHSTEASRRYSQDALALVLAHLETAVLAPNATARDAMSVAANLAGKAINIARTTAAHAVSYPITSYFHVPHGHAAALTLPSFIEFNAAVTADDVQDPRGLAFVQARMAELVGWFGAPDPAGAKARCAGLMATIGLATRLSELGISSGADLDTIVANGFNPQRVKNNPRCLSESGLRSLLAGIA